MPITLLGDKYYWSSYMSIETQYNKGQKDAAKGKYVPPGSDFFPDPHSKYIKTIVLKEMFILIFEWFVLVWLASLFLFVFVADWEKYKLMAFFIAISEEATKTTLAGIGIPVIIGLFGEAFKNKKSDLNGVLLFFFGFLLIAWYGVLYMLGKSGYSQGTDQPHIALLVCTGLYAVYVFFIKRINEYDKDRTQKAAK